MKGQRGGEEDILPSVELRQNDRLGVELQRNVPRQGLPRPQRLVDRRFNNLMS